MEIRFSPLFSGSSGNSTYVGCDDAHILVDAGVSGTRVSQELARVGIDPNALSAILVTHEHADHIKGIGILSRKYDLPVYATEGTWEGMYDKIGAIADKNRVIFEPDQDFFIGSLDITPFSIPHDAAQPVGYTFELDGSKFSIATDIGSVRDGWMGHVIGSDAIILESNYDLDMLKAGRYPYDLKKRIMSRKGHLSNDDAGYVAVELAKNGTQQIILGHLSKENNFPELAMRSCELAFQMAGLVPHEDAMLYVAHRDGTTGMFSISSRLASYT
ncbi:MAG: MBL fold metallo-hydrolase [Clostridia bacterium]|nr:MBL fold metallo-hydrolase [Clostridia bacterium]